MIPIEEDENYAVIGNSPKDGQSKKAWIVPIDEFEKIDPRNYFVTTGEATVKVDVLLEDLSQLTKEIKKLKKMLKKTKGDSDYLETCWEDKKLLIKKKEKRSRSKK